MLRIEKKMLSNKENIFHIRCHIRNKVCNMIIDNGSCTKITSITLVIKLNLITIEPAT